MERSHKIRLLTELHSGIIDKEGFKERLKQQKESDEYEYLIPQTIIKMFVEAEKIAPGWLEDIENAFENPATEKALATYVGCIQTQIAGRLGEQNCHYEPRDDNDEACKVCPANKYTTSYRHSF